MNILGILAQNEWLKTRKRRAFLIPLGLFTLVETLGFGEDFVRAWRDPEKVHSLPEQWPQILGEASQVPVIFGSVVLILLVAGEFSWRTARQNVIDGLSREQWYWSKVIAMLIVIVAFLTVHLGLGTGFAFAGTDRSLRVDLFTSVQAAAIGGVLLSAVGFAGFALMVSTLIRGTGAAMAVWFFYTTLGEMLLRSGIGRLWESARPYLEYAPIRVFNEARNYLMYDTAAFERVTAARIAAERSPPEIGDLTVTLWAAALWALAFVVIGFLAFRRRDL